MLSQSTGGEWNVRMLAGIRWAGVKKGDVVRVPQMVRDQIALRWVQEGKAELIEGVQNKAVTKPKATKPKARA